MPPRKIVTGPPVDKAGQSGKSAKKADKPKAPPTPPSTLSRGQQRRKSPAQKSPVRKAIPRPRNAKPAPVGDADLAQMIEDELNDQMNAQKVKLGYAAWDPNAVEDPDAIEDAEHEESDGEEADGEEADKDCVPFSQYNARKKVAGEAQHPNGRVKGRKLVLWHRPRMIEKLLLHLMYECHKSNIKIPWHRVVHRLRPGSTGMTAIQHMQKMRDVLVSEGHLVPPLMGKAQNKIDNNIRGYIRDMDADSPTDTRAVDWEEEIEDLVESLVIPGVTRGSGQYKRAKKENPDFVPKSIDALTKPKNGARRNRAPVERVVQKVKRTALKLRRKNKVASDSEEEDDFNSDNLGSDSEDEFVPKKRSGVKAKLTTKESKAKSMIVVLPVSPTVLRQLSVERSCADNTEDEVMDFIEDDEKEQTGYLGPAVHGTLEQFLTATQQGLDPRIKATNETSAVSSPRLETPNDDEDEEVEASNDEMDEDSDDDDYVEDGYVDNLAISMGLNGVADGADTLFDPFVQGGSGGNLFGGSNYVVDPMAFSSILPSSLSMTPNTPQTTKYNAFSNGYSNGYSNGHTNGYANPQSQFDLPFPHNSYLTPQTIPRGSRGRNSLGSSYFDIATDETETAGPFAHPFSSPTEQYSSHSVYPSGFSIFDHTDAEKENNEQFTFDDEEPSYSNPGFADFDED